MKDFTVNQMLLHNKAAAILKELTRQQAQIKVCSEMLEVCAVDQREFYQDLGDTATGNACQLQVKYYQILKEITSPIVFKEEQSSNVVQISESFYAKSN